MNDTIDGEDIALDDLDAIDSQLSSVPRQCHWTAIECLDRVSREAFTVIDSRGHDIVLQILDQGLQRRE